MSYNPDFRQTIADSWPSSCGGRNPARGPGLGDNPGRGVMPALPPTVSIEPDYSTFNSAIAPISWSAIRW